MKDHLGSIRMTVDASGNVVGYDDNYPYGMTMTGRSLTPSGEDSRYKFTGKELDAATNLFYFGKRYYDSFCGQWLEVDPMADKYPSWGSYNYCADNPGRFIDPDGDSVRATPQAQSDILNGLPKDMRKYIQFNKNGDLNLEQLQKYGSSDPNIQALIKVGEAKDWINVQEGKSLEYMDESGKIHTFDMGTGITGFTTAPDNSSFQSVLGKMLDVRVNNRLTTVARAKSLAHELYGHAQFYIEGKDWLHRYLPGGVDQNKALAKAIMLYQNQAQKNYEEGQ